MNQQTKASSVEEDFRSLAKQWQTPSLTSFGSVRDLTAGGSRFSPENDPSAPDPSDPAYAFYKR